MNVASIIYRLVNSKCLVVSRKILVLVVILLTYSCNNPIKKVNAFPIISSQELPSHTELIEPKDIYFHDFNILYIGVEKDTIKIESPFGIEHSLPETIGEKPNKQYPREYIKEKRFSGDYGNQNIEYSIEVDTNQIIPFLQLSFENEYPIIQSYPVLIKNNSLTDSLFFPIYRGHSLTLNVIHNSKTYGIGSFIGCGTHFSCVYIPPQQIAITAVPKTKGTHKLKSIIQYGKVKSNEFYLNINPEIFETKELPSF